MVLADKCKHVLPLDSDGELEAFFFTLAQVHQYILSLTASYMSEVLRLHRVDF